MIWVASIHASFKNVEAQNLIEELGRNLQNQPGEIIIAGDFNRPVSAVETILRSHWSSRKFSCVAPKLVSGQRENTGLTGNFSAAISIDSTFVTSGLTAIGDSMVGDTPKSPYAVLRPGSIGPVDVIGASDHVFVAVALRPPAV